MRDISPTQTPNSYILIANNIASSSGFTDVLTMQGSATKTVSITSLTFVAQATTAAMQPINIVKRTTANTGQSSTATPYAVLNSNSPNPSSVSAVYSSNASALGTQAWVMAYQCPNTATTTIANPMVLDFKNNPIILNGTSEWFCINLNAHVVTGGTLSIFITFNEF